MNSIGAIIVASFAVLWVAAGTYQLSRWFAPLLGLSILMSAAIVISALKFPFGTHSSGFDGRIYGIFVTLEVVALVIVAVWINRVGAKQYLIPVIAIIVGLHFFGMVPALHSNEFWLVGGTMSALPLLTMSILPQKSWAPVVGIGCAVILWLSAVRAFF